MENNHAGSVTGIDLDLDYLKKLADAAYENENDNPDLHYEFVLTFTPEVARELIALARATPQHPVKPATSIRTLQFVNLMNAWRTADPLQGPPAYDAITAYIDAQLAATQPKQARIVVNEDGFELAIERRDDGKWEFMPTTFDGQRPRIPASTAATQPEQASEPTYMTDEQAFKWAWDTLKKELGGDCWKAGEETQSWAFFKYGWDNKAQYEKQRRAALAIPASTAASEQQASVSEPTPCKCGGRLYVTYDRMGLASNGWVRCLSCGDEVYSESGGRDGAVAAWNNRAALSGRATIPSEADERGLFEAWATSDDGGWMPHALARTPPNQGYEADYFDDDVQAEWRAWRARAALTHRPATATPEIINCKFGGGCMCLSERQEPNAGCKYYEDRAQLAATPDTATTAADQPIAPPLVYPYDKAVDQQGAAQAQAGALYTCKGKGGEYALIGVVYGAGTSRGTTVNLYRETATGVMYYRTPTDFADRMERIDRAAMAAPATRSNP